MSVFEPVGRFRLVREGLFKRADGQIDLGPQIVGLGPQAVRADLRIVETGPREPLVHRLRLIERLLEKITAPAR